MGRWLSSFSPDSHGTSHPTDQVERELKLAREPGQRGMGNANTASYQKREENASRKLFDRSPWYIEFSGALTTISPCFYIWSNARCVLSTRHRKEKRSGYECTSARHSAAPKTRSMADRDDYATLLHYRSLRCLFALPSFYCSWRGIWTTQLWPKRLHFQSQHAIEPDSGYS